MPSVESSVKTDKGFGLRRFVELSRSLHFTSEDLEVGGTYEVWRRLEKAFHRKYLYDWYSRNHKRYAFAELFVEGTIVKEDTPIAFLTWSKTHGSRSETAFVFFQSASRELAKKIIRSRLESHVKDMRIEILGVAMWRSKKKEGK